MIIPISTNMLSIDPDHLFVSTYLKLLYQEQRWSMFSLIYHGLLFDPTKFQLTAESNESSDDHYVAETLNRVD